MSRFDTIILGGGPSDNGAREMFDRLVEKYSPKNRWAACAN